MTSYDGHVYYGITADRDMLPDADLLGPCIKEALDEARRPLRHGRAHPRRAVRRRRKAETTEKGRR